VETETTKITQVLIDKDLIKVLLVEDDKVRATSVGISAAADKRPHPTFIFDIVFNATG
jgi:hypothetical protein